MKTRPIPSVSTSPIKRSLLQTALAVAVLSSIATGVILLVQGSLQLAKLKYFVDVGHYPLHITSVLLILFGFLTSVTLITLVVALVRLSKLLAIVSVCSLALCSIGLICLSIYSFISISNDTLPTSINNTLIRELNQTRYNLNRDAIVNVENTDLMAKLEKQYECCGAADSIKDYRSRQPTNIQAPSGGAGERSTAATGGRGRTSSTTQRNVQSVVLLPISCCNEKYRTSDGICADNNDGGSVSGNVSLSKYNLVGCFAKITKSKYERIQRQGFTTVIGACLAVVACIGLAAAIRLLAEGYQIVPVRTT
ncbi:unnamed protein product [Didymodactylos carnosus]|uniref:Tetraspanin n=1 Tax=Didymodactylos carnosus TaxID=1234261 RepID=A0A814CWY2_9BILA|nr:unnamed protein product [Didymodactylos carnosus]CAF1192381.1 unnamed protein product [Didymodactylos carnosus]CAF3722599.1 unnamed protein product [Didymodactylos carnosus]CAF4002648.1 unnamed protein product [Didymodactylos carnosus]